MVMANTNHPCEKPVETIAFGGATFEVVERPDVLWVGCVDYAANNTDESDIGTTLKRYREELIDIPKRELVNPDWSASLSINYTLDGKAPKGIMFAQETYTSGQDARYELFTQPGGLWLRIRNDHIAARLLGKDSAHTYEYFAGEQGILQCVAKAGGYMQNPDVPVQVEYHCHAEYNTPPHTNFAYIPIIKA